MKKRISITFCYLAALAGAAWYAFQTGILILHIQPRAYYNVQKSDKKTVVLYWYNNAQLMQEKIDILWPANKQEAIKSLVLAWLAFMQEENGIPRGVQVEKMACAPSSTELFISCSESIFNNADSIIKKWRILEGFFATLKPLFPDIAHVRLLVKDKALEDNDIDCTSSLPVASHLQRYQTAAPRETDDLPHAPLIIVHPHGDKDKTGHTIHQEFERTYTRYIAQTLQDVLQKAGHSRVIITHEIGHRADQEYCATLANRLNAALYIHVRCFETKGSIPEVSCYFPLYNPTTDFWVKKRSPLSLTTLRGAYLHPLNESLRIAMLLSDNLKKTNDQTLTINPYYGLPLIHALGLTTPSITIECGIPNNEHTKRIAHALAEALNNLYLS